MEYHIFNHREGDAFTTVFDNSADVEFVNPQNYYYELFVKVKLGEICESSPELLINHSDSLVNAVQREWIKFRQEIQATSVPKAFLDLLRSTSKDEQIRLLRSQTLTVEQLIALSFKAGDEGFTYSQYLRRSWPKNIKKEQLPKLAYQLQDGNVRVFGDTSLKNGEVKQTMNQRKAITSFFFDRGNEWHCIFGTYRSIYQGEKSHKGGQAHFHYLSDKFGVSRELVLERFSEGNYTTSPVHIDLLDYGNQTTGE